MSSRTPGWIPLSYPIGTCDPSPELNPTEHIADHWPVSYPTGTWDISPGVRRTEPVADYSLLSGGQVIIAWKFTSTSQRFFMLWCKSTRTTLFSSVRHTLYVTWNSYLTLSLLKKTHLTKTCARNINTDLTNVYTFYFKHSSIRCVFNKSEVKLIWICCNINTMFIRFAEIYLYLQ
jgi:hypothetical protein